MNERSVENRHRIAALAQRINRSPRLVGTMRGTRERLLGDGDFVNRLSVARGRRSDRAVQQLMALREEEPGLFGELGLTALQAWQRLAESQDRGRGRVDVAILFTDLVGFSSWALEAGDSSAVRLLGEVAEAIEPPMIDQRGEVVKRLGDGLMAAFWDAPSAVEAAFEARDRIASVEVDGYRPLLRVGIHLGRPRKLGGDYVGVDVNVAARLTEVAKPGELLVSDRTLEALEKDAFDVRSRRFNAKGTPKGLSAYALSQPAQAR